MYRLINDKAYRVIATQSNSYFGWGSTAGKIGGTFSYSLVPDTDGGTYQDKVYYFSANEGDTFTGTSGSFLGFEMIGI